MELARHYNDLLASGRCARCAERVSRALVLRAAECPECGSDLDFHGGDVLAELDERRAVWRGFGYLLVAAASFFAGAIPLMQVGVQIAAIFVLHVVVLRRGLLWLSPARRVFARISMKMLGAVIAAMALLVNVAVAPFLGVSAAVLGLVGPVLTALYVEGGLFILRRRLRWEAAGEGLKVVEWGMPVVFLLGLAGLVAATVGAVMGSLHLLATADVPTVSEFAKMFLEMGQ
jgi:hypothetical protein